MRISVDLYIVIAVLILNAFGSIVLYSSTGSLDVVFSQNIKFLLGFVIMLLMSLLNKDLIISKISKSFYFLTLFLLLMVFLFGDTRMGATRWLDLYFISIQPSELMKLALPMMLAYYIFKNGMPNHYKSLLVCALIIGIPMALILVQPDLGTSILIALSGIYILFISGLSWVMIFIISAIVFSMLPLMWGLIKDYQKERVLAVLNPESDPLGSGYHVIQSKIAIGSGGFSGEGYMSGSQTQLDFIPEQHSDFIFTALAEEFGFVGVMCLLFLYGLIIYRIFYHSVMLDDLYGKLIVGAIGMTFTSYIFVNIGMVSGILPVVGVPLPFFSYGGTFLITQLVSLGLVFSFINNSNGKNKRAYNL